MSRHSHLFSSARYRSAILAAFVCLCTGGLAPSRARAGGVVGTGTAESCTDAALDAALDGGGLVTFNCGAERTTIDVSLGTGSKTIAADTIIDGGRVITISGGGSVQLFRVHDGTTFTVRDLTIADGHGFDAGGIVNAGALTVIGGTFAGNDAHGGGAIVNNGTLIVSGSTFVNNSAAGILLMHGGAITNQGELSVFDSTFAGNAAPGGSAIANVGTLRVANSTFFANVAPVEVGEFGAIQNMTVLCGDYPCQATVTNTIMANVGNNCAGPVSDGGHNLDSGASCGFSVANGSLNNTDPRLDPAGLGDHGGPTQTVALCTAKDQPAGCAGASPAVDSGDAAICSGAPVNGRDQRGFVRAGAGQTHCSIGAYEVGATTPGMCIGDCDEDGTVAVDELVLGVGIDLGRHPESTCPAFGNALGVVDIAQLVSGVHNALTGCRRDDCVTASGGAAASCAADYAALIGTCRLSGSAACEADLRAGGGGLAQRLASTEGPVRDSCTVTAADRLTFLAGVDDLVARTTQACRKWGEDLVAHSYAADLSASASAVLACQDVVGAQLAALHDAVVRQFGPGCYVQEFNGRPCDRSARDAAVAQARTAAATAITSACGTAFDSLTLVPLTASPTLAGRIDAAAGAVVDHAAELAQRVYPPLNLGATGLFGPAPVGVRRFELVDPSRLDKTGSGPRPVNVELYYPSTPEAVAGIPRDAAQLFGVIDLFVTPAHRDVARAAGTFPLVLLSGGSQSDPWNYAYLASHLASHGFLVAGLEHHGDHAFDGGDADNAVNRPLDLSVTLDQFLALNEQPDNFLSGAIDPARIGATGHSAGGYTVVALATCPFSLGTFADPRIKAILPLDPSAETFLAEQSPAIFSAISVPTLVATGTLSRFAPVQRTLFDALEPGPAVRGLANLIGAVHGTFSGDTCEISDELLLATGPPAAECEPGAVPWRYARHIIDYLALNFFDAALNGNAEALARLEPAQLSAAIEDVQYESKGDCTTGASCALACAEVVCGDGIVGSSEACDRPGEQGACGAGALCNGNCTACAACGDATVIDPDGETVTGTTVGGTTAYGAGSCGGANFAPERLFAWTPSVSHEATIQTCGGTTDYDTALAVREGSCVGAELACNDDGDSCGPQSKITLAVEAGHTYYIVVSGEVADAGNFTLSIF